LKARTSLICWLETGIVGTSGDQRLLSRI